MSYGVGARPQVHFLQSACISVYRHLYITEISFNICNGIIFSSLNRTKIFDSIPDEPRSISSNFSAIWQITRAVINTSKVVKCPLLWRFWIYNFSQIIFERIFVGSIVNTRKECFFLCSWEWIGTRNKRIAREPLRGRRYLIVAHSDSFPMNPEKKRHSSFINCDVKADMNSAILLETAALFFLFNLYLKQGISSEYVMVDFICMCLFDLWRARTESYYKNSCLQWDSYPVPCAYETNSLIVVLIEQISIEHLNV